LLGVQVCPEKGSRKSSYQLPFSKDSACKDEVPPNTFMEPPPWCQANLIGFGNVYFHEILLSSGHMYAQVPRSMDAPKQTPPPHPVPMNIISVGGLRQAHVGMCWS
ncbi:hypothetical protein P7K49_000577, partial [Saguinus oedipus]